MSRRNDVFTLGELNLLQRQGNWSTEAFLKPPYNIDWQYGYAVGGSDRSVIRSDVDRVDYSNDLAVASVRGYLAAARGYGTSVSSRDYGYSTGGRGPSYPSITTNTQRISYANDTATAVPKGDLSQPWRGGQTTDTINYGYLLGGMGPGTNHTLTNRIDFSNDTAAAVPKGNMNVDRYAGSGCGNEDYGYAGAGLINAQANNSSSTSRMDYSNDTNTLLSRGNLSAEKRTTLSSSSANFGYWAGYSPSVRVDKFDFSNDTAAAVVVADLPNPQFYSGATGNASFGYYMAGYRVAPSMQTTVNRLDYSNDTASMSVRGPLTFEKLGFQSVSAQANAKKGAPLSIANQGVGITTTGAAVNFEKQNVFSYPYGYTGGGVAPPVYSTIQRIDFSNDTATASIRGPLSAIRYTCVGASNSNFGYFGGGSNGGTVRTYVDRIDFSNDNVQTVVAGPLATARGYFEATGTENYGWFAGGTGPNSRVERVDFSNDTPTASPKGNLMLSVTQNAAAGNKDYGWHVAGAAPPIYSTIQRIDYSNDTVTASQRGPLSSVRYAHKGSGNKDYGWFTGGGPGTISTVDRIDYSNDTGTTSIRGPLSQSLQYLGATSSANSGYYVKNLTTDKIDFSNDTSVSSPRGALALSITQIGMLSGQDDGKAQPLRQINQYGVPYPVQGVGQQYGYIAGGYDYPSYYSSVERIDYINDTVTAVIRGPLTQIRANDPASVGNINYGYVMGGYTPGAPTPSRVTSVDRIDYSNDTASAVTVGPINGGTYGKQFFAATGNLNYAWAAGGAQFGVTPAYASTVDRIDYSSDTSTASARGNLSLGRAGLSAAGNLNYGWFAGGSVPTAVTTVDRIDYSNDTPTATPKGPLNKTNYNFAATGNANYGYFAGGRPAVESTVGRIDYSNDTATALVRGPLSFNGDDPSATGNKNYGWFAGSDGSPNVSSVSRIDYSNDTATASPRGPLTSGRYSAGPNSAAANGLPQG